MCQSSSGDWYENLLNEMSQKSCINCVHGPVCGMYLLLFNSADHMKEYEELYLGFDEALYETLAENCRRYEKYKS